MPHSRSEPNEWIPGSVDPCSVKTNKGKTETGRDTRMKWHYCYFNANPPGRQLLNQPALYRGRQVREGASGGICSAPYCRATFSTRTHTKGLAEITYTPRAPLGPQTSQTKRKTFSSHEIPGRKSRMARATPKQGGKQTAKATKSENLNPVLEQNGKRKISPRKPSRKKEIRKRYQVFIYMTFVCHSTSGRARRHLLLLSGYCLPSKCLPCTNLKLFLGHC